MTALYGRGSESSSSLRFDMIGLLRMPA